jgi:two-component system aerobic respiration control sensor histidine kinase ArcB
MRDNNKTKKQLIAELAELRQRIAQLEASESWQRQEEELFRILRSTTPIGLFIIQDGKLVFVNEDFRKVTGHSPDELIGTDSIQIVLPEDRVMVREAAIQMLKGQRSSAYQYRLVNKDGRIIWMLQGLVSTQYHGKRAALGFSTDITELVETKAKLGELYEREKKLREELETEVNKRIEFTRALVHELKTPLTPVLSSSDLLISELREEPWLSVAKNIYNGACNLDKRVDELLDLAKSEIGVLRVTPKAIDACQLLKEIAEEIAALVSSNRQTLTVCIPPSLSLVWADEERLRQVVLNLAINATKFTPEKGVIALRAKEKDDSLIVEVQDTGPGISEQQQKQLFQLYHREIFNQERFGGLGIGLALCKSLIELHGGKIWVESSVGNGSTFSFSLPLATASQREKIQER